MAEEEIELNLDTKQIIKFFQEKQKYLIYAMLGVLIILAFFSRTQNVHFLDHKYLLSPDDPYYFYRMSMYIAMHGHPPANDTMRYYPNGFDTKRENLGTAYLAGYLYRTLHSIGWKGNMFDIAAYYAPTLLAIGLIPFFFLVRELFDDDKIAIIATGLIAFSNGILFRTMGGFLEKEPLFWPLFITAMLFITLSFKRNKIYYPILAGVFTSLAGFSSGLFQYIFFIMVLFISIQTFLNKINKNVLKNYSVWLVTTGVMLPFLTLKYGDIAHVWKATFMIISYMGILIGGTELLLNKYRAKIPKKIPMGLLSIVIGIGIGIAGGYTVFGIQQMNSLLSLFLTKLSNPLAQSAFGSSVSENQPPTFFGGRSWWGTFNVTIILFYIGAVVLFSKIFKTKNKKLRYIVTSTFAIFLLALILDHFSGNPNSAIDLLFSPQIIYWSIFIAGVLYFIFKAKEDEIRINEAWLILLSWLILSIVMAHGAVRLFFMLSFPVAILSAYAIVWGINKYKKNDWVLIVGYSLTAIYILFIMYTAFSISSMMNPGLGDWYIAMHWISNNTPKNAVFTHWWDYGYLVQAIGQRATVVDPGNFYVKRDYDTGSHLFNAHNLSEVIWYGNKYGHPNYWLICSEDVLKFYQISRLGSLAENASGRTAYLTVYSAPNPQESVVRNVLDTKGEYLFVLQPITGYQLLFEDFQYNGYLFDGNSTFVVSIMIPFDRKGTNMTTYWPWAQVYDKYHNTATLPVKCVCYQNYGCEITNKTSTIPICVEPMNGGYLVMPENVKDTLFAKLYLFNLTVPGFKLVYDGPRPLNVYTILGHGTNVKIYEINWSQIGE